MDGLWPRLLLLLMTLVPMGVRLGIARSARRRIRILDDVICYLGFPLLFLTVVLPLSPFTAGLVVGIALSIVALSIWGDIREYRRARRVDGPPDGR